MASWEKTKISDLEDKRGRVRPPTLFRLTPVTALLDMLWAPVREFFRVLSFARFSLVVVLGALFVVYGTGQGRELESTEFRQGVLFVAATWLLAFQTWFWARLILADRFPRDVHNQLLEAPPASASAGHHRRHGRLQFAVNWVPRLLGMSVFGVAIASTMIVDQTVSEEMGRDAFAMIGVLTVSLLIFTAYVIRRRRMGEGPVADGNYVSEVRWAGVVMIPVSVITLGLFTYLAITDPVSFGFYVGSGAAIFLAFSVVVPVGSYLVFLTSENGFPVILALVIFGAVGTLLVELHDIRVTNTEPKARAGLNDALAEWYRQAPTITLPETDERVKPLIVVAAAGGGLPAAHWTATVLGALEDAGFPEDACFHQHVFAMSGVSGGSVGASAYLASLAESLGVGRSPVEAVSREALSQDFLAPTIVSLMFSDVLRHFAFPLDYFADIDDRAKALEQAWERQWHTAHDKLTMTAGMATPFTALSTRHRPAGCNVWEEGRTWTPALLLNGVVQETGQRLIFSHIDFSGDEVVDAIDFFDHSPTDIPLSTAAHNSARFPYLSPAGTLVRANLEGHVIDGGYFENFGAATAYDLMQAIARHADDIASDGPRILPVVIQISSDTNLDSKSLKELDPALPDETNRFQNEVRAPLAGLFATRTARGTLAAKRLWQWTDDCARGAANGTGCGPSARIAGALYYQFQLSRTASGHPPGLGWQLSRRSIRDICLQIRQAPEAPDAYQHNAANFRALTTLLMGNSDPVPTTACPP